MTVIAPYKRHPVPPAVCWLDVNGNVTDEYGECHNLDELPADHRVWTDFDTVRALVLDGRGEALCWLGDEIRWRHRRFEDGWTNRRTDVAVLKLAFPESYTEGCTRALALWRSWLSSYGASPTGTTGSAAWSLLRATLDEPLFTSAGWRGSPERVLKQTLGARMLVGPAGPVEHEGHLEHWDLPAAYASELGQLPYGGRWYSVGDMRARGADHDLEWWGRGNRPVFVRAKVRIPAGLEYGPLPKRPTRRMIGLESLLLGVTYPVGCELQGLWTLQEIDESIRVGCRVTVLDAWVHVAGGALPFSSWWDAIQAGRSLGGLAGTLAKVTGNALWGRFCMDARAGGSRTIRTVDKRGRPTSRRSPMLGGLPPSHDLAETVSGRVRAKLHAAITVAGDRLVSAHTDGFWSHALHGSIERDDTTLTVNGELWRLKERARRLQVLNPQGLRYWPSPPAEWEPGVVLSGVPARSAHAAFEARWDAHLAESRPGPAKPRLSDPTAAWDAYRGVS